MFDSLALHQTVPFLVDNGAPSKVAGGEIEEVQLKFAGFFLRRRDEVRGRSTSSDTRNLVTIGFTRIQILDTR